MIARAATLASACLLMACSRDVPIVLDPMDGTRCTTFCASTLRVEVNGSASTHACGTPITLDDLPDGELAELVVTTEGTGIPLEGHAQFTPIAGEATQVSLQLEPTSRPVIDTIRPVARTAVVGDAVIEVVGRAFGSDVGRVEVAGAPVEVLEWASERILVRTPRVGAVVVERCGIASAPVDAKLREPSMETLRPIVPAASCPLGRLVGISVLETGVFDAPLGVFDCGQPSCGAALFGRLGLTGDRLDNYWGPFGTCPSAIGQFEERRLYFADGVGLARCRLIATGDHTVECTRVTTAPPAVRGVAGISEARAYFVVAGAGPVSRELWIAEGDSASRLLPTDIPQLVGFDGRYMLALRDGVVSLHELDGAAIARTIPIPGCAPPCRVVANRAREATSPGIAVTCTSGETSVLHYFDLTMRRDGPVGSIDLGGLSPDRVALSLDGSLAVLWAHAGTVAFFDTQRRIELDRWSIGATYAGADLVRAPRSDVFFFGGPEAGAVMRLDLR